MKLLYLNSCLCHFLNFKVFKLCYLINEIISFINGVFIKCFRWLADLAIEAVCVEQEQKIRRLINEYCQALVLQCLKFVLNEIEPTDQKANEEATTHYALFVEESNLGWFFNKK